MRFLNRRRRKITCGWKWMWFLLLSWMYLFILAGTLRRWYFRCLENFFFEVGSSFYSVIAWPASWLEGYQIIQLTPWSLTYVGRTLRYSDVFIKTALSRGHFNWAFWYFAWTVLNPSNLGHGHHLADIEEFSHYNKALIKILCLRKILVI